MSKDSQGKPIHSGDKVVSLSRHEFVADIEQKLVEARRLFSLHEYVACEALLGKILELDPHNPKARALDELTAIKLSKRKLYKKIVDRQSTNKSQMEAEPIPSRTPKTSLERNDPSEVIDRQQFTAEVHSQGENLDSQESSIAPALLTPQSAAKDSQRPEQESSSPVNSLREQTIAALVQLFNEKEKTLETWRLGDKTAESKKIEERLDPSSSGVEEVSSPRSPVSFHQINREVEPAHHDSFLRPKDEPVQTIQPSPSKLGQERLSRFSETKLKSPGTERRTPVEPPSHLLGSQLKSKITEASAKVSPVTDGRPSEKLAPPKKNDYQQLVKRKLKERSEDLRNSEIKTVSIAQIKKYLYQEEYVLCALELEKIRNLFPHNTEIQAFVDNTSRRLTELQRIKSFEVQARELMLSANAYYQEGKLTEALIAVDEVLRVMPEHPEAKAFANFVQRRLEKETKKGMSGEKLRHCKSCGVIVDLVSQYCYHCGYRLS